MPYLGWPAEPLRVPLVDVARVVREENDPVEQVGLEHRADRTETSLRRLDRAHDLGDLLADGIGHRGGQGAQIGVPDPGREKAGHGADSNSSNCWITALIVFRVTVWHKRGEPTST